MLSPADSTTKGGLTMIGRRAADAVSTFGQKCAAKRGDRQMDTRSMAIFAIALLCITAPLELSQIAFALVGAVAYVLVQATQISPQRSAPARPCGKAVVASGASTPEARARAAVTPKAAAALSQLPPAAPVRTQEAACPAARHEIRQPSSCPVKPPTFAAPGFDAAVAELLGQISPSSETDKIVEELASSVKHLLRKIIPEVEVVGFASGDLMRGTAFGVAVPEVDIVVSVQPHVLAARLQGRVARSNAVTPLDARKLQKSAIRACTDRLVSGGFKFRRSAFRGQEPKVTLLAPASLGLHTASIALDFSVNCSTPLYNAALLTECGQMEPRAKGLILFVRRWAKDRGVCHAAKGHLSPYAWSLLTIYFLQVGVRDDGPLLPPLEGFELSSGLAGQTTVSTALLAGQRAEKSPGGPKWTPPSGGGSRRSVAALFKELVNFYGGKFDWRNEAVSVRLGRRAAPELSVPIHVVLGVDGVTTEVGPSIEDPFDKRRNIGDCTTAASIARLREELARAQELCARGASLTELLEPWVPPDRDALGTGKEQEGSGRGGQAAGADGDGGAPLTRARGHGPGHRT